MFYAVSEVPPNLIPIPCCHDPLVDVGCPILTDLYRSYISSSQVQSPQVATSLQVPYFGAFRILQVIKHQPFEDDSAHGHWGIPVMKPPSG